MSYWKEKVTLKHIQIPRFIGGPLDGITDSPFRKLVRCFSQDELLYGEMRHVSSVVHEKSGVKALQFQQKERPFFFQVSANTIEAIEPACEKILAKGVDGIDLNIGCPAKNVIRSGSGSYLMSDLPKLKQIVTTFRQVIPTLFTVKIRAGFKDKNALDVALLLQDCGVDALAIHPRLQTQMFAGVPDYEIAATVKKALTIPVFFSGGVVNWQTAKATYEKTGVDGFLIGRGMWSKPWKLKELYQHSIGETFIITQEEILTCALAHLDGMLEYYGDQGLYNFRKHLPFYIKGRPTASALRSVLVRSQDVNEVKMGLKEFFSLQ